MAKPKKKSASKPAAKKFTPTKKSAKSAANKKSAKPAPKAKASKPAPKKLHARARAKAPPKPTPAATIDKWRDYVRDQGVVLASARGPVPSLAAEIAGEPIVGSWWSHEKANTIFDVLSAIDEDVDVRCFRLVHGKVTFVHRRMWPALVKLARAGVLAQSQVESVHQEHTETGEHRNFNVAFPAWVPEETNAAAEAMSLEDARAQFGWL